MTDHSARNDDNEPRVSLRHIDPDVDLQAEDRFVNAVMLRISVGETPRAVSVDALYGLWSMQGPLLVAACIAIAAELGAWNRLVSRDRVQPRTVVEATGVPPEFLLQSDKSR